MTTVTVILRQSGMNDFIILGEIPRGLANQLMDSFSTRRECDKSACYGRPEIEYLDRIVENDRDDGGTKRLVMLSIKDTYTMYTPHACDYRPIPCVQNDGQIIRCDNSLRANRLRTCAKQLRDGKCVNRFIRNTVGQMLFPQHYGKQKTK